MKTPTNRVSDYFAQLDADKNTRHNLPYQSPPVDRTPPSRKQRRKRKREELPVGFEERIIDICTLLMELADECKPGRLQRTLTFAAGQVENFLEWRY